MSRTIRKYDRRTIQYITRFVRDFAREPERYDISCWDNVNRHHSAILRGDDGAIASDKCQTATIDREGGYKLNHRSYLYQKSKTKNPQKKARQAGKNLIKRQLEEYSPPIYQIFN